MPNEKIDSVVLPNGSGSTNTYDIDLPADATPSIKTITTSSDASFGGKISEGGQALSEKYQAKLTAGNGIKIENNAVSIDTSTVALKSDISTLTPVSGTNDGTNWTTITIQSDTYNIPQGGGATYTAGNGIDITNDEISVDTSVVALKTDIPTNHVTTNTNQTISGFKIITNSQGIQSRTSATSHNFAELNGYSATEPYMMVRNNSYIYTRVTPGKIDNTSPSDLNCFIIKACLSEHTLDTYTEYRFPSPTTIGSSSTKTVATLDDIPTISGTNDGTYWTAITIGNDTYSIPQGGGGGSNVSGENDGTYWTSLTIDGDEYETPPVVSGYDDGSYGTYLTIGGVEHSIPTIDGSNDGTYWTSLTINGDTYDIPQGGGSGTEVSGDTDGTYWTSLTIDGSEYSIPSAVEVSGENDGLFWTSLAIDGSEYYIPPVVSGNNEGTYWTSIDIGTQEYKIPMNKIYSDEFSTSWRPSNGSIDFRGIDVWTDGENTYLSKGNYHYVGDKINSTWVSKTWTGLTNFYGQSIWTWRGEIYYSNPQNSGIGGIVGQYILDKSTSTWTEKTWGGFQTPNGDAVWDDGINVYYTTSYSGDQYQLDEATDAWISIAWTGLNAVAGGRVGTYEGSSYMFYSNGQEQYKLEKGTQVWTSMTWQGLGDTLLYGENVGTDGYNIYYSRHRSNYILDNDNGGVWISYHFSFIDGASDILYGSSIWTPGDNFIYYSDSSNNGYSQLERKYKVPTILEKIAETGSYNDLKDKPESFVEIDRNATQIDQETLEKLIDIETGNLKPIYIVLTKQSEADSYPILVPSDEITRRWASAIDSHGSYGTLNLTVQELGARVTIAYIELPGGGSYTAGTGIDITNNEISVDSSVVALKTDIPDNYVTTNTTQSITGVKSFNSDLTVENAGATNYGYVKLNTNGYIAMQNAFQGTTSFTYTGITVAPRAHNSGNSFVIDLTSSDRNIKYVFNAPTAKSTGTKIVATTDQLGVGIQNGVEWSGINGSTISKPNFVGSCIWYDGDTVYYSKTTYHYVLNKTDLTWSTKTGTGLTNFSGSQIGTDGTNIYYSSGTDQYILDRSSSTWSEKTGTGLTDFNGNDIWSDGVYIYYSNDLSHYKLNPDTSTGEVKTGEGLSQFYGKYIGFDNDTIYYSYQGANYVLNTSTSTGSEKIGTGLTVFDGGCVGTDGTDIYYSNGRTQYILDRDTSTWNPKSGGGSSSDLDNLYGTMIGTDGTNTYFSNAYYEYQLVPTYRMITAVAEVAETGSYNDLKDKPEIPAAVSGTNDGINWTSLTVGNDTYNIPQGSPTGLTVRFYNTSTNMNIIFDIAVTNPDYLLNATDFDDFITKFVGNDDDIYFPASGYYNNKTVWAIDTYNDDGSYTIYIHMTDGSTESIFNSSTGINYSVRRKKITF